MKKCSYHLVIYLSILVFAFVAFASEIDSKNEPRTRSFRVDRRRTSAKSPVDRQDIVKAPGLNINNVSPIELSLGGLTGLQGLPPLSLIQLVKLLVAVMPFILPLIFVPLLIFTVGMFLIPVQKPSTTFIGEGPVKRKRRLRRSSSSWSFGGLTTFVSNAVTNFMKHDQCLERAVCEAASRGRFLFDQGPISNQDSSMDYRKVMGRVAGYFQQYPVIHRLSEGIFTPNCQIFECNIIPNRAGRPRQKQPDEGYNKNNDD